MAAAPLAVTTHVRDIHLEIDLVDSCNCLCCEWNVRAVKPHTPVTITPFGSVELFDPRSTDDLQEALKTALANLKEHIREISEHRKKDGTVVIHEIERIVGIPLREEAPPQFTLDLVHRINEAMKLIFSS